MIISDRIWTDLFARLCFGIDSLLLLLLSISPSVSNSIAFSALGIDGVFVFGVA